ncbi:MAG TPA: hypothetical protein VEF71_24825 [Streptosporangiaceae bacterium]|nr:hypothetical protein [Streptosporangiaceae bacterium]
MLVLLGLLLVFRLAADLAGLGLLAGAGLIGYAIGRHRKPAVQPHQPDPQIARLRAELQREHVRADQAEASARAAWDAASDVAPRPDPHRGPARDRLRLVTTPRSGVHELGGPR